MVELGGSLAGVRLPLRTARLLLRLNTEADAPILTRHINEPGVLAGLERQTRRYSKADEVLFIQAGRRAASKGERLPLAITLNVSGEHIGGVGLDLREGDGDFGSLGYWLTPQYWHQGYGSEAVAAVCRLAFETLKLHRIDATVFDSNTRSVALLRRLGFRKEGHRREVRRLGRRWEGEAILGLLRGDFRPPRPQPK